MEIDFLKRIIKEANKISEKSFDISSKGGENDLVTSLDLEIEKYLINEIKNNYPDFDIVSEEFNTNGEVTDNCFIIDPIDGTINFANDLPLWGIQVACRKNGETIASVISFPRINELYYADSTGAYLNDKKISVNVVPIKNSLYSIDGSNNLPCMQRMRKYSSNRRNFGGVCVSMSFVAAGRIHGAVFRSDKPWDYEPGLFICKMAGAKIKSINGFHAAAMNQEFLDILEKETAKKIDTSNIFVLHSLNGDTLRTWGQDIKEIFGGQEIDVFLPEFDSSYEKFNEVLSYYLDNKLLNKKSIVVMHGNSNSLFTRFCKEHDYSPQVYIEVSPEMVDDSSKNINSIKYCLYSDDNNINKYEAYTKSINSTGIYLKGYNQFDESRRIYKIPELNELISKLL